MRPTSPRCSRGSVQQADVVWAVQTSSSGAGNLARQFSEAGFEDTHFFHNYGLTIADARETAGGAADGALTMLNAGRVDALLEEQGALEAWSERTDMDMTGSAALSYQNIKVIAEYASTFESLEAFRSASVEEWGVHGPRSRTNPWRKWVHQLSGQPPSCLGEYR